MIFVLEIAFLAAGLYAIFTAKMPSWMVGKGYKAEGNPARLLGILMAATLPGIFCGSFTIGIVAASSDFDPTFLLYAFEIGTVVLVAIISAVILRRIRQPDVPSVQTPSAISEHKPE